MYFPGIPSRKEPSGSMSAAAAAAGRELAAPRVGLLHCIDPSPAALAVAQNNLKDLGNCRFHVASVDEMPIADNSMDFGYALGVLHHVPDTVAGIESCVSKLKPNAPLLVYIYYAFDNRPNWFRLIWRLSNALRAVVCRLPFPFRYGISQVIAATIYYPLARLSKILEKLGWNVRHLPLFEYRYKSFYSMRTDALDRFGTRIEKRFTANQIRMMMKTAGLTDITFSPSPPYWCAVGYRAVITGLSSERKV